MNLSIIKQCAVMLAAALACLAGLIDCSQSARGEDAAAANITAGIVRLEVVPRDIALRAARETAQLIVTGYDAAGIARDLTHAAEIRSQDENIVTVERGRAIAHRSGQTALEVRVGKLRQTVAVKAENIDLADPVRFRSEVLPALTKQGCNAGSCHGAPEGKGGLALSMLAYKPSIDEGSLITGGLARRVEPLAPDESLLLKKPLLRVTHVGGKRLHPADAAFAVLRDWIAEGAHADPADAPRCIGIAVTPGPSRTVVAPFVAQQLKVMAQFSDGGTRDVTRLSTFDSSNKQIATIDAEGLATGGERGLAAVTVRYLDFVQAVYFTVIRPVDGFAKAWNDPAENNYVDRLVHAKLKQLQFVPSDVCDDATFLRRVHLDLTGLLPTAAQVRSFLADSAAGKRAKLIDELLASESFARAWAQKEADLYRVNPQVLDAGSKRDPLAGRAALFNEWLVGEWRKAVPYDQHVRELLTAVGDTFVVGPSNFFEAIPKQDDISEATAQLFMGSRINCAKCHNHPFESWTQDDYYRIVAVFTRVRQDNDEITVAKTGEAMNPSTGKVMVPWGLETAKETAGKPDADRRAIFTEWLTRRDNPYFARVAVNRLWAHLLGRGIVHPVDDFRSSNPPTNPELLDALAADFEQHGFDRKHIVRTICNSRTYQRSTATTAWNESDRTLFSHYVPRRLTGEQLRDAIGYVGRTLPPVEQMMAEMNEHKTELTARLEKLQAEQLEWEQKLHAQLAQRAVWTGVWHSIGKFKAESNPAVHEARFVPDLKIDFAAMVDARALDAEGNPLADLNKEQRKPLEWTRELDWYDDDHVRFDLKEGMAQYYHTALHAREEGTALIKLTTDAAVRVSLDGAVVYDSGLKGRAKTETTEDLQLKLTPGAHSLLVKITALSKTKQWKLSLAQWNDKPLDRLDMRADVIEHLAGAAAELSPELRAVALERRQERDGTARKAREAANKLQYRMAYHTQRPFPERSQFAEAFGQPKRETACACERLSDPTLDQALNLLNGAETQHASVVGSQKFAELSDDVLPDEVYLAAYGRKPSDAERGTIAAYLNRPGDRVQAIRDLLWSLFNTQEFLFQH